MKKATPILEQSKERKENNGQFKVGHIGIGGRPKGSRNKLSECFIDDIYQHWMRHGMDAVERVWAEHPEDYLRVVASVLPRDINVNVSLLENMTDAELDASIKQLLIERNTIEGQAEPPLGEPN